MNNKIEFDETEVLRVQVAHLLQRIGELEADKSRLHAMLQVLAQKQVSRDGEPPPEN